MVLTSKFESKQAINHKATEVQNTTAVQRTGVQSKLLQANVLI